MITLIGKRSLLGTSNRQQLNSNFEVCLDGFSSNVQELLNNLEFRNQILRLSAPDALGTLIEEFGSLDVNFSSEPVLNADGSVRLSGLDNHLMSTTFKDLVRRLTRSKTRRRG